MLLAVDVGNTDTVIGLYDTSVTDPESAADGLVDHWRIATHAERTSDEHAVMFQGFLAFRGLSFNREVNGIAISSGVPRVTANLRRMAERYFDGEPIVLGPGVRTGVSIHYDNPKEVGADRIANAVAAFDLFGGPTIMCDFGTATTCDAISAEGDYLGGAIAPGIEVSMDALFGRAAALRQVELVEPASVLGTSTVEAVQSGMVYGFAAQVDGLCERIVADLGECTIVGTGGLAGLIAPVTKSIQHVEPWLTLHGLRLVHAMNTEEAA
jgi:type III pantothenate kinase